MGPTAAAAGAGKVYGLQSTMEATTAAMPLAAAVGAQSAVAAVAEVRNGSGGIEAFLLHNVQRGSRVQCLGVGWR